MTVFKAASLRSLYRLQTRLGRHNFFFTSKSIPKPTRSIGKCKELVVCYAVESTQLRELLSLLLPDTVSDCIFLQCPVLAGRKAWEIPLAAWLQHQPLPLIPTMLSRVTFCTSALQRYSGEVYFILPDGTRAITKTSPNVCGL